MKSLINSLLFFFLILNINSQFLKTPCRAVNSYGCSSNAQCCPSPGKRVLCVDMKRRITMPAKDTSTNMCADRDPFNGTVVPDSFVSPNVIGSEGDKLKTSTNKGINVKGIIFNMQDLATYASTLK